MKTHLLTAAVGVALLAVATGALAADVKDRTGVAGGQQAVPVSSDRTMGRVVQKRKGTASDEASRFPGDQFTPPDERVTAPRVDDKAGNFPGDQFTPPRERVTAPRETNRPNPSPRPRARD